MNVRDPVLLIFTNVFCTECLKGATEIAKLALMT